MLVYCERLAKCNCIFCLTTASTCQWKPMGWLVCGMLFSNGASWLLVLSLLGSCLLSCFGCPICLANVLLLTLRILPAHQSAEKNLHVKRSCYGPLPCVPEVGRLNYF